MDKIINIEDYKPHEIAEVICLYCMNRWISVHEQGEWLAKWDIPYDEIVFGKVWPGPKGFYVDDRSVRPDEFLNHTPEELAEICEKSRLHNGEE